MEAFLERSGGTDWMARVQELPGADPSRLPGRKLVAEACLVDLLAPLLAETSPIPEHLDHVGRAGWCGWSAGPVDEGAWVTPPDARTVTRYASELRVVTEQVLEPLVKDLILRLFKERVGKGMNRPLNATSVKRLVFSRVPWIHREQVNRWMMELADQGWFQSAARGFRMSDEARRNPSSVLSQEVILAELFQDLYPGLTGYVDLQPGAMAGMGRLITTPERMVALSSALDEGIAMAVSPFAADVGAIPPERRVVYRLYRLLAPADEALSIDASDESPVGDTRKDANAEAALMAPFVAAGALPGWGDPDEAWRGLKGALAMHLESLCGELPGGLYRAAHRRHGIGSGTLASYFDGPMLISRHNGRIRAVREGGLARLEGETLSVLSQVHPEIRSERWLWEQLSERAQILMFQEFRGVLAKLAREGFLIMSRRGTTRFYRSPRPFQAKLTLGMWERWQKLWNWLPALRETARGVRHGCPGASIARGQWIVDRQDLSEIEAQIQRNVNGLMREESERGADLEEVDHLAMGGIKNVVMIFPRMEPWLLAHLEDM